MRGMVSLFTFFSSFVRYHCLSLASDTPITSWTYCPFWMGASHPRGRLLPNTQPHMKSPPCKPFSIQYKKGLQKVSSFLQSLSYSGGDEGSRTPVQKACPINFSERSYCFMNSIKFRTGTNCLYLFRCCFPPRYRKSLIGILLVDAYPKSQEYSEEASSLN